MPGISYHSALLIKSEIGDVSRFPSKFKLISYAGLYPSIRQSGRDKGTYNQTGFKNVKMDPNSMC